LPVSGNVVVSGRCTLVRKSANLAKGGDSARVVRE
jgi:hypothetical protein